MSIKLDDHIIKSVSDALRTPSVFTILRSNENLSDRLCNRLVNHLYCDVSMMMQHRLLAYVQSPVGLYIESMTFNNTIMEIAETQSVGNKMATEHMECAIDDYAAGLVDYINTHINHDINHTLLFNYYTRNNLIRFFRHVKIERIPFNRLSELLCVHNTVLGYSPRVYTLISFINSIKNLSDHDKYKTFHNYVFNPIVSCHLYMDLSLHGAGKVPVLVDKVMERLLGATYMTGGA